MELVTKKTGHLWPKKKIPQLIPVQFDVRIEVHKKGDIVVQFVS